MRSVVFWLFLPALASAASPPVPPSLRPEDRLFFEKSIRPLLHRRCFSCHSLQAKKQRGGLLLDSRAALLAGGDSGPALDLKQPLRSLLLQAIRQEHDTIQMPPEGKLPEQEILLLQEWVRRGAPFPQSHPSSPVKSTLSVDAGRSWWAFQPARLHPLPAVRDPSWARTRSDLFLLHAMQTRGLRPSPPADRPSLLRRLYLDLIGLPPTPEQLQAFVSDDRPDAYERVVDQLLASPEHGERWARHWLDLVRYCDVPESWTDVKSSPHPYRDWVIHALNKDLGYDAFISQQLAADLLPGSSSDDLAALGFLGISPTYWKELKLDHQVIRGVVAEEWEERIHTLTSTVLGLTVACARCHDHKFDPISMHDYYALAGVFASIRQVDLELSPGKLTPGVREESLVVVPDGPYRTKLTYQAQPQNVAVQIRGNPASTGPLVPRRFLSVLDPQPSPFRQGSGRRELAQAMVGKRGDLAARVIVNRIWKHHFGEGIVRTPSDFGTQGEKPSHPELLDDLTARFLDRGWSLKWLHREILLSSAYRQQVGSPHPADPENRWLSRFSRRKLEVEVWRDAMLFVTASLRRQLGGPALALDLPSNDRRTIYGQIKRRELADLLRLHDVPDASTHSPARVTTTTPLQLLFALNSPLLRAQAQALTNRLQTEAPNELQRLQRAYLLLFARDPTPREITLAQEFLREASWVEYAQVLLASNEFQFVD